MRNTFPVSFFKILLNSQFDFVIIKRVKISKHLKNQYVIISWGKHWFNKIIFFFFKRHKAFSIFADVLQKVPSHDLFLFFRQTSLSCCKS